MRLRAFTLRVLKEIVRDPLTLIFGLGFPLVLLLLLSAIQANIPVELFAIESLTPGIAVFGLSFMTLFSATVIAKDRSGAFLQRLYTTPMRASDYILGYTIPMLPVSILQTLICYAAAAVLGLEINGSVFLAILVNIPASVMYVALGLLFGSILTDKQVGDVCGALLTNLSAWLSGTWFDLNLVGGAFKKIADFLPFSHAVELGRAVLNGGDVISHLLWVAGYAAVLLVLAVIMFVRQMKK
ncbi:MAG: ABC transporter permease [Oscillospiraceae bacterium]|nr:ABC transporter permease [Oscillospiraceae bacterium]